MPAQPSQAIDSDLAARVAAQAASADGRAGARLSAAIADVFADERDRLDERSRVAINRLVETTVAAIERDVAGHAARLLEARGLPDAAALLAGNRAMTLPRLIESGLMRDPELMAELIAQARVDLIDEALAAQRAPGNTTALLTALADSADGVVRGRTVTYLVADSRRRLAHADRRAELPHGLNERLVWWVAAALRERLGHGVPPEVDRALSEASQRSIAAHDDGERVEAAAAQLAAALDPGSGALPQLMIDSLGEARTSLFAALLSHALGIEFAEARGLTLDADSDRLWLALRALGLERHLIAQIGFVLCEADRERDVETLPDSLDRVATLAPETAARAVAPLTLHRDFRAAVRALARSPRA
ncbi:DUF2336 domain-containing protein [Sphingomonas yunnanensis]|uniref:DUF2336 domain-containing protein n=1 Tax=Sphingomonas yunnanensis TaxID=310400 RepID=UPI001CA7A666|nr:DUF2336 domain-containing protein [Sphingomonas yunnanensis]MBY9062242.1 DUF2336 domain-containing protein [Sphingomonas yunnanensis]